MSNSVNEMLRFVQPYYSESALYTEQNRVKGDEFDLLKFIIEDFKNQLSPATATWGLPLWENLCGIVPADGELIEDRRNKVIEMISSMSPLTPYFFKQRLEVLFGETFEIFYTDWGVTKPYDVIKNTFLLDTPAENNRDYIVDIVSTLSGKLFDLSKFHATVRDILSSHLAYEVWIKKRIPIAVTFRRTNHQYYYGLCGMEFCGTKPEIATLGDMNGVQSATKSVVSEYGFDYKLCGTISAGI